MIRAHHNAILAALAQLDSVTVFDAYVPNEPPSRYVVLYTDGGRPESDRLCDAPNRLRVSFQVTSVGTSREQCAWLAERVRSVLLNKRLPIDARSSFRVRGIGSQYARRDDDIQDRVVMYAPDTYELVSTS